MSPLSEQRVLIMAGGTGGHVYPALAVAEDLRRRGYGVTWLGTRKGIEARVVPEKNIPILFIASVGVRGKGVLNAVTAPWVMLKGFVQSLMVLLRVKPVVVLGMGGFVSVPGGIASWLLRKPLVIHEQNAVAGTANRLLSHFAQHVLTGFDRVLPRGERVGNPVRREIAQLPARTHNKMPGQPLNVLVLGGSLGAQAINEVFPRALRQFASAQRPKVWHQTGSTTHDATLALYKQQQLAIDGAQLKVTAFIDDMASAYAWADVIVCRAGAITLAEVMCIGLPAVLIPLPNAIDDHQSKNAAQLAEAGAAIVVPQVQLTPDGLVALLVSLSTDTARLQRMSRAALALALPDATRRVADICLDAGHCLQGGAHG